MAPPARLYSWGARALFLGEALGLSAHRNAVGVLALGLEGAFDVALDPADPAAGQRRCRAALIPPNTLHHLTSTHGLMAFLYVDARSPDLARLQGLVREPGPRAGFDLAGEAELIASLARLARGAASWSETRPCLDALLCGEASPRDPRIKQALDLLHADPAARPSLAALAAGAGLSTSRFIHLFKTATGVPLRRYKLWIAMGAAMRAIVAGETLTNAALDAGFASSAHFSASFREMFGMEPSRLSGGRLAA
ncbi:helix-turn-helix domain-containing protein [Phenylobacterium sp.]|uniref:helix-turn-helix domain-containing protein n=1 Tax=Phenylobacterium sp. TaxID=1871053 RepID=UPI0027335B78|nr:helix-turn-helix domain-containing protein [Phenylobacterium sp.]MDP3852585.1 helix-turn-helix domain-containing protein [Phenylobacterium sp.]